MNRGAYLVVWWMSQVPYAAVFENRVAAEAAASVRNALLVTISGDDARVDGSTIGTVATTRASRSRPNSGTSSDNCRSHGPRRKHPP